MLFSKKTFCGNDVDLRRKVHSYRREKVEKPGDRQKKRRLDMYIDAGTGSMLLQAALAAFFTAAVFWKNLLAWCRAHFGGTAGPER